MRTSAAVSGLNMDLNRGHVATLTRTSHKSDRYRPWPACGPDINVGVASLLTSRSVVLCLAGLVESMDCQGEREYQTRDK